jgi:hypothetical protein
MAAMELLPRFVTAHANLNVALRICTGDLLGAVVPVQAGLLTEPRPVIIAGIHYPQQWTRDAAVNAWNAGSLLLPEAAGNGLQAVVEHSAEHGWRLPHRDYYDAVVWLSGCRAHVEATGDQAFARMALAAGRDLMAHWERGEFDGRWGLFRGGSFFNDGISAYPERYAAPTGEYGNIRDYHGSPIRHPDGGGLPMHTLSTNCLYVLGYEALIALANGLGEVPDPAWSQKAEALRRAIRQHFFEPGSGRLRYLVDGTGSDDRQELAGWAFARLAGVLSAAEGQRLATLLTRQPFGIPSLWPTYERYAKFDALGRHSGLVWPQVVAFWGDACARDGDAQGLGGAIHDLAEAYVRIGNATECWHPANGLANGGWQEYDRRIQPYPHGSRHRTTWGATGLLRLMLHGVLGLRISGDRLTLRPCLPMGLGPVTMHNLRWRDVVLDLTVSGCGTRVVEATVDGAPVSGEVAFAASESGRRTVVCHLGA